MKRTFNCISISQYKINDERVKSILYEKNNLIVKRQQTFDNIISQIYSIGNHLFCYGI